MSLAFLLTSFAVVATPGTGVILTVAAGLRSGTRASLVTATGCTLGIVPHLVAAVTGTAALLRAGGQAFEALKVAGVLYLLYLAWSTWRDDGLLDVDAAVAAPPSPLRRIANAVLANLLNPKLTLFFFAFLPQFVSRDGSAFAQMAGLGGVFMVMTFVVFAAYGWGASAVRRHLVGRPRVVRRIRRAFSLSYLGLGVRLAGVHR